ncbi:unnamed protein product [Microthlaspi erraticum]|uniref:ENT domain-containing protein n=1 Tax=Microthlaspi erraticum TaxID=1685480 RepID=A0A6D2L876_9BRAS|nr:unnamed protein product [Microthlaspi erraticum]
MSNQKDKDKASDSPSQATALPFKKRGFAGKTPPTSSNSNNDASFFQMNENLNDYELKTQAYSNVLGAFTAESSSISSSRITILDDLKKAWNITKETHNVLVKKQQTDPLIQQLSEISVASDEKGKQEVAGVKGNQLKDLLSRTIVSKEDLLRYQERLNAAPAKMPKPSSPSKASTIPGWGKVSPASLVDKWVNLRMPGEDKYVALLIKAYDAETEMHHLVESLSQKNFSDPCDWIDLRHVRLKLLPLSFKFFYFSSLFTEAQNSLQIPAEDMVWQEGHPGFPTRSCFLKPGETILNETSTVREKKQLKEVGKTAGGIPIIRKVDKGKGIALP